MALRYLISGGDGYWSSTSNWSASSGGAGGASVPNNLDNVFFDINSLNANITVTVNSSYRTLTVSDYTGTVFLDALLTGSTSGSLQSTSVFTIQSLSVDTNVPANGKYLQLSSNGSNPATHDLGLIILNTGLMISTPVPAQGHSQNMLTSFTVNGFLGFFNNTAANLGSNGITIYLNGSYIDSTTNTNFGSHNTTIEFINSTPVIMSSAKTAGAHNMNFIFNGTGDILISGAWWFTAARTITRIQGNITVDENSSLNIARTSTFNLDTNTIEWQTVNFYHNLNTALTVTLFSDLLIKKYLFVQIPTIISTNYQTNFVSNSPGAPRKMTLMQGSIQFLYYAISSADIDSSDGQTIYTFTNPGVNPSGINWKRLEAPKTLTKLLIK